MAKVLLFCVDKVGHAMAGPAIRYWEMAKALSAHHEVTLMTLNKVEDLQPENFKLAWTKDVSVSTLIHNSDILITQTLSPLIAWQAKKKNTKIILDAYDPMPLENLEIFRQHSLATRNRKHDSICKQFAFDFQMADAVICANQRQRDLWMGFLLQLGKITPSLYDSMPSLEGLIGIVPFGLSSKPPLKSGSGLRERFNIPASSKVLLWGGGIWNWFDPLTLIHAMHHINREREDIHLVFMGVKHPNEAIPEMEMSQAAISLAKELKLLDRFVHVNYGWIPYADRQNFLLDADIGVSTHFDNLETRYSFRTRMLDYLWAGLPIVATQGDDFADLIASQNLGMTVPFQDSLRLASTITTLCDQPALLQEMRRRIAAFRPNFEWTQVVQPLHKMIQSLIQQEEEEVSFKTFSQLVGEAWRTHGPVRVLGYACRRFLRPFKPKQV